MIFFLWPFKFVFELIGFLISAAFIYGLALIASITFLVYMIADMKTGETIVEYVNTTKTVVETVEVEVSKTPKLICKRLSGCEIVSDAKTEEEYCPTCVWDK